MAENKTQKLHIVKLWKEGFDDCFTFKVYAYTTLDAIYRALHSYQTGEFNGNMVSAGMQIAVREIVTDVDGEPCGTITGEHPISYTVNGGEG